MKVSFGVVFTPRGLRGHFWGLVPPSPSRIGRIPIMARIEVSQGEYLRSVDAATTSEVLPYDLSYPFVINYVIMDHNGPVALNYSGRGTLSSRPNEETDLLVLGDPYRGSRLEAYRVAKEATPASLERLALVTSGLEAGWTGKRKKVGATADWIEAFEYARKAKKGLVG